MEKLPPRSDILNSFLVVGQIDNLEKYKRFERLSEIFTWLAVGLGLVIIHLPFATDINRKVIYVLAFFVSIFVIVWYHLLPKSFSGRRKRFIYSLITITFIAFLVHFTNGVQGYATFFYLLSMLSVAMTLPTTYVLIAGVYVVILIFVESFLTSGALNLNLSLAVLHSWGVALVTFFSRFNAGIATLAKKKKEETILEKEKSVGKLKDEFVYIISHALKQPAVSIKGYVETIRSKYLERLSPEYREILVNTETNSLRLEKLLNDLTDISQIEKGGMRIDLTDVSLGPPITEVVSSLLFDAQRKRISLIQKINEDIAAKADVGRLKEVLTNLVSNAIKYTPEGGKVVIEAKKEEEFAKILVTDNGFGISEESQEHLFEKFYRIENEQTKSAKGSGLGLFITRQLVEKMGGKIGFTSKLGEGTTFYFTLARYR